MFIVLIGCKTDKSTTENTFSKLSDIIDNYGKTTLKRGNINSIALAIYKNGEVHKNYFGELDKGKNNTPNDNTIYEIASITKTFTGSLAAKAVLENKIGIDDDIRNYLEGDYKNLEFEGTPITIRNLVTHTLGFKEKHPKGFASINDSIASGYYNNRKIDYNFDDFLTEIQKVELDKKPGTFFEYNNVGSELMAYILQKVYQKDFKELVYDFLQELGMNNTYLMEFEQHKEFIANGYDKNGEVTPYYKNPLLGGAGGAISTLPDLIKLVQFQLESNSPIVKEATRVLFKDDETQMGYLWQDLGVAKREGFYYSKTGNALGTHSGILICPDSNYAEILIVNNDSEAEFRDFFDLFYTVEKELIEYPKLNLLAYIKPKLLKDKIAAVEEFNKLKSDTAQYFNTNLVVALNRIGYEFLNAEKDIEKATEILELATKEFPENANAFDSLGEVYFLNKAYQQSKECYQKSKELVSLEEKPNDFLIKNANLYLKKIDSILDK